MTNDIMQKKETNVEVQKKKHNATEHFAKIKYLKGGNASCKLAKLWTNNFNLALLQKPRHVKCKEDELG